MKRPTAFSVFRLTAAEDEEGQGTKHKINARVARISDAGVGLKFCDFDTGVFRSLQEIMSYKKNTPTESIVGIRLLVEIFV